MAIGQLKQRKEEAKVFNFGEPDELGLTIYDSIEQERQIRNELNTKWLDLWHLYKTKPLKLANDTGWQSKLNDGRVFEVIETVGSYIRNALFYSDQWVQLDAREPGLAEVAPLANAYFIDTMNSSNFKREFRLYLVQLLLTGNSAMAVKWDNERGLLFETLSVSNTYIESSRRYDPNFSFSFYDTQVNFAEFSSMYHLFNELDYDSEEEAFDALANVDETEDFSRVDLRDTVRPAGERLVNLVQYFCPIEQKLYYMVNNCCIGTQNISEPDWVWSSLFETPESAYGLSVVDSSIGLILENNVLMNRRLDNIAVSVDNMWLFVDDGVTNPDDIRTQPGKVITVGRPDALTPLRPPSNNFNVTYTEAQTLDTKIDRNIGTGAGISANAYRTGERVTATEIRSVKDAGGNRLTDLYEHVETVAILPLLHKAYALLKKHTNSKAVVKLSGEEGNARYFEMLPEDLRYDYRIRLSATKSIINRDREIQLLTDFLTLTANVPQFQQMINYSNLYFDLLVKFGFDDPSRYVLKQESTEQTPQPTSPLQSANETMERIAPGANIVPAMAASGDIPQMMQMMATGQPPTEQTEDLETQMMSAATMGVNQ